MMTKIKSNRRFVIEKKKGKKISTQRKKIIEIFDAL